jgi:dolichol kinase
LMVSKAFPLLAEVAVSVTVCVLFTALVVTANVPLLWPAAMVMLTGTVAAALLLLSVTSTPPDPAGADNVTVPVEGEPPVTVFGDTLTPVMVP